MPWLIALFMAMIYFVPVDGIILPIHLPFNAGLDRIALGILFVVWAGLSLASGGPPRFKHTPINVAVYAFLVLGALSLVLNLRDLAWNGEMGLSLKQFLLASTYVVFFYIVASSLNRNDMRGFAKLIVILAALSAIGTIIEYRTGHDYFGDFAKIFPGAHVGNKLGPKHLYPGARVSYAGPTLHGLADATLLAAGVPFAMILFVDSTESRSRWLYGLAVLAIIAGCVATQEKTALILLAVAVGATVLYRPRRFAPYWPLLIVAAVVVFFAAPHSISSLIYQFQAISSSNSTSGRTTDYPAVSPFIGSELLFGRGFGSYEPHKYRILDNQMLLFVIETGVVGVVAYAALVLSPLLVVHRKARRPRALQDELLVAVAAGSVVFLISNFLYDTFSFRQGPYVFFFLAALAAVATGRESDSVVRSPEVQTR